MKTRTILFIIWIFLTSYGQKVTKNTSFMCSIDGLTAKQKEEEPDTKKLRKAYVSNYNDINIIDTIFSSSEGKRIRVHSKYYCLFDNAVIVPEQYVWENTTEKFMTHSYSHDITIVIDKDTIFNRTITKADFSDKLYPELLNYAVLMVPDFSYDKEKDIVDFVYSISIPITDVGEGWRLRIDKEGNVTKTNR